MGETLGESAPAYSTVAKWHAEFKRGRWSSDDLHRCGRPATSVNEETVEEVKEEEVNKFVMSDRRLSVCYIATSVETPAPSPYYADLIGKVLAALKEKRRRKLRRGVLFHQDNAPAHTSSEALHG